MRSFVVVAASISLDRICRLVISPVLGGEDKNLSNLKYTITVTQRYSYVLIG